MKKFLLSLLTLNAICLGANAEKVTYMYVKTNDGNVERYDVEKLYRVEYGKQVSDTANSEATLTIKADRYGYGSTIDHVSEVYYRESDTDLDTATVSGKIGNYDYVDLGLPSGLKWATYNVGANKPTGYGDHFRWGDILPLDSADYYKWLDSTDTFYSHLHWLKVAPKDSADYSRWFRTYDVKYTIIDSIVTLEPSDDAATANWGAAWRMPRIAEQQELIDGCFWKWTDNYFDSGVAGYIGTSKTNGNTIFLPATDVYAYSNDTLYIGKYWPCEKLPSHSYDENASCLYLKYSSIRYYDFEEDVRFGHTIRAVSGENPSIFPVSIDSVKANKDSATISGKVGNYTYVDLGLASGTKWATCNVGANKPSGYGNLYCWGETSPKAFYDQVNYKWGNSYDSIYKYNASDGLKTLLPEDDAATVNWGADWRMPTKAEIQELLDGCEWTYVYNFDYSGIDGYEGKSKANGSVIFLPSAGCRWQSGTYDVDHSGSMGAYWSSSLSSYEDAVDFGFCNWNEGIYLGTWTSRYSGESVRAVVK